MPTSTLSAMVIINRVLYPRSGFQSGDWCILSCRIADVLEGEPYDPSTIIVKGHVFSIDYGKQYRFVGTYVEADKYGPSYSIATFSKDSDLTDPVQQRAYLESLCAQSQVAALYEALPDPFSAVRDGDLQAIQKAKGFGETRAKSLVKKFNDAYENASAYAVLTQYGLSTASISTLLRKFSSPEACIAAVENNPYLMISDVDGIGWARADAIALAKGIPKDSPERITAFISHFLDERSSQGDTWTTPLDLINATFAQLEINDQDLFRSVLYTMHDEGILWWNEDRTMLGLARLRRLEEAIASELHRVACATPSVQNQQYDLSVLQGIEEKQGWAFTEEQRAAIQTALSSNVVIITGGAGTGKSSAVSGVLASANHASFAQCALSGRAAARLTEVTGVSGQTIHRLLGYQFGEFTFNSSNPLPYDIIILDEVSMVGAEIFHALLQAIPDGGKLIMLGDDGQLESIGLCNIFSDMLKSGAIPVARLTKIHRQAARSAIITESVKVREQTQLIQPGWVGKEIRGELQDLELDIFTESIVYQDTVLNHYRDLLAQGISPYEIQVVVPMRARGSLATFTLNRSIQQIVNPGQPGIEVSQSVNKTKQTYKLSAGDRVIMTKNTYDASRPVSDQDVSTGELCPVYNGDRGIIREVDSNHMVVDFDLWGLVYLSRAQMSRVELGYALTCHKLQGSEAPYIIIGLDDSSFMLATKEWLYTALTRAQKHCILCAQSKMLTYAVSHSNIPIKRTMLEGLLREAFHE